MTMPGQVKPGGAYEVGGGADNFAQELTESGAQSAITGGTIVKYSDAEGEFNVQVRDRIDGAYDAITVVEGYASDAVDASEAAANAAAAAEEKADAAYDFASYWIIEHVVASAAVVLGDNEVLLGPVLNVPDDREAICTDIHIALIDQPAGMELDCKKWNAAGTDSDVIASPVLGANVTRLNVNALTVPVLDKERFFNVVTSVTGSVAPLVLQIAVAGVFIPITP